MLTSVTVWVLRILAILSLVFLCWLAGSNIPAIAFALAWGPNALFLALTMRGAFHLPRVLVPVQPIEPLIYRRMGIGFVKRIVATRMWPLLHGMEPPPTLRSRHELLEYTERLTENAEACHGATFVLVCLVTALYVFAGQFSDAVWVFAFNLLFNGYPVMLQRSNRWRVQQMRTSMRRNSQAQDEGSPVRGGRAPP